ncbi:hypothetical protein B0H14DRAFT_1409439 [Mycena olivaceomarginata]|nr:hypothetical protein B0H14DRAFT_1409439 [Mycena olivaceomarginata]
MPQPPSLRRPATLCDPVASPTALPATGSTRHVSQLLGSPPRHTSPRSRQIPDPSRPQRGIAPASVAPRRFRCVRATRVCGVWRRPPDATSRTLTATTGLPNHSPRLHAWSPFIFPTPAVFSIPPQAQRHNACHGVFWNGYDACRVYTTRRRSLSAPPRCIYNTLPWHTRPLRWPIHRLASVCTDVHSRNPIARRRHEARWPYRSRLPACTIPPLPSPMMPWPPCAVVETMSWVLSHPRDSPGFASPPPSAHPHRRRDWRL